MRKIGPIVIGGGNIKEIVIQKFGALISTLKKCSCRPGVDFFQQYCELIDFLFFEVGEMGQIKALFSSPRADFSSLFSTKPVGTNDAQTNKSIPYEDHSVLWRINPQCPKSSYNSG